MANVIHEKGGKRMVQMYHKGVPYFKEKVLKPRLPEWLQEVEYLESTGKQWIDTGIILSKNFVIYTKYQGKENSAVFYNGARSMGYDCVWRTLSYRTSADQYNFSTFMGYNPIYTDVHNVVFDNIRHILTYNGEDYPMNNVYPTLHSLYIFAMNNNGDILLGGAQRFYSFSLYVDGINTHNLLPCYRKSDSKPGIYNIISGEFFVNQGTGEDFLIGPDHDTMVEVTDNTGIVEMYAKSGKVRGK